MTLPSVSSAPPDSRRREFFFLLPLGCCCCCCCWLQLTSRSGDDPSPVTRSGDDSVGLSLWSTFNAEIRFGCPSPNVKASPRLPPGMDIVWTIFDRCKLVLRGVGQRSWTLMSGTTGTTVVVCSCCCCCCCINLACSSMAFRPALNRFSQSGVSGFGGIGNSFGCSPPIVMTTLLASKRRLAAMEKTAPSW